MSMDSLSTVGSSQAANLLNVLARNWWVLAVRGVLAILFGVVVLVWPEIGLPVIIALVGAYMLVDGIFSILNGFRDRNTNLNWWMLLLAFRLRGRRSIV